MASQSMRKGLSSESLLYLGNLQGSAEKDQVSQHVHVG